MVIKWVKVARGVRYKEHSERKHNKIADRYYTIYYSIKGKDFSEGIGWSSDGVKQETCEDILKVLRTNHKSGIDAQSYKEMREENIEKHQQAKAKKVYEKNLTVTFIFEDYLNTQMNKNSNSITKEKQLMKSHILPFFADTSIKDIDSRLLDEFLRTLQEKISSRTNKSLSPATIRYTIAVLRQVWNYALSRDIVNVPFPLRTKQPREDNKRTRFLTHDESDKLLNALKSRSIYIHDIALISLYCGLRQGEIFKLQWGDVNFEQEYINVRDRKNKESGIAYLPDNVKNMLIVRHDSSSHKPNEFIFANKDGTEKQFMSKTFAFVVNELELNKNIDDNREKVVFHTLRHTFASWLAQQGVSMFELAELMGHKDITMTQRYSHHNPDKLRKSAMLINNRK